MSYNNIQSSKSKIDEDQYRILILDLDNKISKEDLRSKFKSCGDIK